MLDALKTHRRDQFIGNSVPTSGFIWTRLTSTEWVKALLAVPFVLYSQPHGPFDRQSLSSVAQTRDEAHRRYSEILRDVEVMIDDHSEQHSSPWVLRSPFSFRSRLTAPAPSRPPTRRREPLPLQTQAPGPHYRALLYPPTSGGRLQVPGPQALHFVPPLRLPVLQRRPPDPQLGPDDGCDHLRHPSACHL